MSKHKKKNVLLTLYLTASLLPFAWLGVLYTHGMRTEDGSMMHGHYWILWTIGLGGLVATAIVLLRRGG